MIGRVSTRELAMQANTLAMQNQREIQMHRDECIKTRDLTRQDIKETRDDIKAVQRDLDEKHEQNQSFQRKVMIAIITLLGTTLLKLFADSVHLPMHFGM
jgi:hypothetical protein